MHGTHASNRQESDSFTEICRNKMRSWLLIQSTAHFVVSSGCGTAVSSWRRLLAAASKVDDVVTQALKLRQSCRIAATTAAAVTTGWQNGDACNASTASLQRAP